MVRTPPIIVLSMHPYDIWKLCASVVLAVCVSAQWFVVSVAMPASRRGSHGSSRSHTMYVQVGVFTRQPALSCAPEAVAVDSLHARFQPYLVSICRVYELARCTIYHVYGYMYTSGIRRDSRHVYLGDISDVLGKCPTVLHPVFYVYFLLLVFACVPRVDLLVRCFCASLRHHPTYRIPAYLIPSCCMLFTMSQTKLWQEGAPNLSYAFRMRRSSILYAS